MFQQHSPSSNRIGVGLRAPHIEEVLATRPALGWVEIHSENWMTDEGPVAERLQEIRNAYPLSLHGVGRSLGSADGLDKRHLLKLAKLAARSQPFLISEHLSWGAFGGCHSNGLLPMPYNEEAISVLANHIDHVQQVLGRQILVENLNNSGVSTRAWEVHYRAKSLGINAAFVRIGR